jgi:WS/DGAT/MGAT family acyltransferase
MEHPTNHMVVTALLLFEGELAPARVRGLVRERLGVIARMRAHVAAGPLALWHHLEVHDERELDLDLHVREHELAAPGDDATLHAFVSETMSRPLEPSRPLWELCVVRGLRAGGHRSALLARVHHALGDGIAQMLLLLSLTDLEPEGAAHNPLRGLFERGPAGVAAARAFVHRIMPHGMRLLLRGDHQALEGADHRRDLDWQGRRLAGAVRSLASLVARKPDTSTILRGHLGEPKRAAWSRPLALDSLSRSAHALGVTINDLLLAALCGALRRYLLARGESPAGVELRAAVPINLRGLADMAALGNRFGLLFLTLPIDIVDPRERLAVLHRRMTALEHSAEPLVTWAILGVMGYAPKLVEQLILAYFAQRVSMVMTNVPGPEQPLWLAGQRMSGLMFWVPQSGRVGLGISICSYAGEVRLGVASDAGLVPEPSDLVAGFHAELASLAGSDF